MGGHDDFREPLDIEAEEFIGVKSFKAKGKRLTTFTIAGIEELEPTRQPEPSTTPEGDEEEGANGRREGTEPDPIDPDEGKSQSDVADEINGQLHLF